MANVNPNSNTSNSQRAAIRRHLEALNHFGCARLASRIDELRQAGMGIETRWLRVQNRQGKWVRVAEYWLAKGKRAAA